MSFGIPVRNGLMLGLGASTALSTRAGAKPAMFLNFLQPFLDSRITFSRGTNATLIDSTGRLTYAPNNLLQRSQEFDDAYWVKNFSGSAIAPIVTANAGIAPDGTATAERVQFNCVDNTNVNNRSFITPTLSFSTGVRYVASVWVKAFDLANVGRTLRLAVDGVSNAVFTLTADWQRITVNGLAVTTVVNFLMETRGTFTTQTADVLLWGAQLEAVTYQTTPSTYVATTSAAYYGPRFDYDPVTLAPRGLLIEEARTNLALYSDDFGNAAWAKTAATITANATSSPDGTTNADKLVATAVTSGHFVSQAVTITASTNYTVSVYVKAAEYSWAIIYVGTVGVGQYVNLATGAVGSTFIGAPTSTTVTNAGNGWRRVNMVFSSGVNTSADVRVYATTADGTSSYLGDGTSGIYVWGADLEAGSFATSYIPTVASTVTRNADVATMTGTNFSTWYNSVAGSFVSDFQTLQTGVVSATSFILGFDNSTSKRIAYIGSGVDVIATFDGTTILGATGDVTGAVAKIASTYTASERAIVANGGAVATGTVAAGYSTATSLNIGQVSGVTSLNGWLRTIAYFNTRLPNAQLQTLTAPSLATTLSLDFTSGSYNVGF